MRPSSVLIPVAKTTPRASPPVQLVPLNARSCAVSTGTFTSTIEAERSMGTDSPVSEDMSTSMAPCKRRRSAAIRSPASMTTMSPGTSSAASISCGEPSRTAFTRWGMYLASASTACSACTSWTKAKAALRKMMRMTAAATTSDPTAVSSPAAIHSSSARGCVNWRASSPGQRRPPRRRSSFRPYCNSSRRASAEVSPARELCRSRRSRSAASSGLSPAGRTHASWRLFTEQTLDLRRGSRHRGDISRRRARRRASPSSGRTWPATPSLNPEAAPEQTGARDATARHALVPSQEQPRPGEQNVRRPSRPCCHRRPG